MRLIFAALALVLSAIVSTPASAAPTTCVLIGDSIDSHVGGDVAGQLGDPRALTSYLLETERDVVIRNLSSPGALLGGPANGPHGYNGQWIVDSLDHMDGFFGNVGCIIITAGTNDFGNGGATWGQAYNSIVRIMDWAAAHNVKVLMVDLIWRSVMEAAPAWSGRTSAQYRNDRMYPCLVPYGAICRIVPRPAAFNVADPSLYEITERPNNLTHPNAAGHRIRATAIEQVGDGWAW